MQTVLITGFGPFPGAPINPTELLVARLGRPRRALSGVKRVTHVFATTYAAVDADLPRLIARHRPSALLMFGLATRTPYLRIETRARNAKSLLFPDAAGAIPGANCITPGGPPLLAGRAPFQQLLAAARKSRVPVKLSCNAGSYLCNYLYWRASEAKPRGGAPLVVFVHVPQMPMAHVPRARSKRRRLILDDVIRAGEAMLATLAAAARARN